MSPGAALRRTLAAFGVSFALAAPAAAVVLCDDAPQLSAAQKDRIFRFAAVVRSELEASGAGQALIARSGLDLGRFGIRYSHAGVSLQTGTDTPWSVRQLYFACDAGRPLIFDQGLTAFLMGSDQPGLGWASVLLLPADEGALLQQAALDDELALRLLGAAYSANAYPFALDFQNCNQWLVELLATAWGATPPGGQASRADAQRWLRDAGYEPTVVDAGWMAGLTVFVPWLHRADHPQHDLDARRFRVSLPAAIEAFVAARLPAAQRIEFCHDSTRVVVRRNGPPIADGCVPADGDRVVPLD